MNASLESLFEKQPAGVPTPALHVTGEPVLAIRAAQPIAVLSSSKYHLCWVATQHARYLLNTSEPLRRLQAPLLSNKTHYSPADTEVRISVKPGKARVLNYLCRLAVDEGKGVISCIHADSADRRDSVLLPSIVEPLYQRLAAHELPFLDVVADMHYSNGLNYALKPGVSRPRFRSSVSTSPKSRALHMMPQGIVLLIPRASSCPSNALTRA
jgi:hypothetical protein